MLLDITYSIILLVLAITVHWSFLIMLLFILILGRIIESTHVKDFVVTESTEEIREQELPKFFEE